jgi:hypothetical protein
MQFILSPWFTVSVLFWVYLAIDLTLLIRTSFYQGLSTCHGLCAQLIPFVRSDRLYCFKVLWWIVLSSGRLSHKMITLLPVGYFFAFRFKFRPFSIRATPHIWPFTAFDMIPSSLQFISNVFLFISFSSLILLVWFCWQLARSRVIQFYRYIFGINCLSDSFLTSIISWDSSPL